MLLCSSTWEQAIPPWEFIKLWTNCRPAFEIQYHCYRYFVSLIPFTYTIKHPICLFFFLTEGKTIHPNIHALWNCFELSFFGRGMSVEMKIWDASFFLSFQSPRCNNRVTIPSSGSFPHSWTVGKLETTLRDCSVWQFFTGKWLKGFICVRNDDIDKSLMIGDRIFSKAPN